MLVLILLVSLVQGQELPPAPWDGTGLPIQYQRLSWLIGKWRSDFDGKVSWPTVPALTYGEELDIALGPGGEFTDVPYIRFEGRTWSHSTKDRLLDWYGYLTSEVGGNCSLITTGNNGFNTLEVGRCNHANVKLELKEIGRSTIARSVPTEDIHRQFQVIDQNYIEQIITMRTASHPAFGLLEHVRILYKRVKEPAPRRRTTTVRTEPPTTTTTLPPTTEIEYEEETEAPKGPKVPQFVSFDGTTKNVEAPVYDYY